MGTKGKISQTGFIRIPILAVIIIAIIFIGGGYLVIQKMFAPLVSKDSAESRNSTIATNQVTNTAEVSETKKTNQEIDRKAKAFQSSLQLSFRKCSGASSLLTGHYLYHRGHNGIFRSCSILSC